jgi:hypothetical protein
MRHALTLLLLAAGLAGCAGSTPSPSDTRNDKEAPLSPGQGAFGSAFTWEWRKKDAPAPAVPAPAAAAPAAPAQAGATPAPSADAAKERQEFEEWRAWQEWKKKNAK